MDKLEIILYDNHIWEVGYFQEKDEGYNAYGFRQDGTIIRVTSQYEANLFRNSLVGNGGKILDAIPEDRLYPMGRY
jgi:hypothetical protein